MDVDRDAETRPGPSLAVFACFDSVNDADLHERLSSEAAVPNSGFSITGRSQDSGLEPFGWADDRREIQNADLMIVLCGEHTEISIGVATELRIAEEEETPHFLLWGRRGAMCTKPVGAAAGDAMYSWTAEVIRERIDFISREAAILAAASPASEISDDS